MKRTILIALAVPLFVLAGCADGSDPGVATAAGTGAPAAPAAAEEGPEPAEDPQERGRQFAQCMRDHGVDMPDPDANGGRVEFQAGAADADKIDEAQQACQRYAPGSGGTKAEIDPATLEQMRAFSQCMRDNGVPGFPDPSADDGMLVRVGGADGLDAEAMEAAQEACKDLQPEPPGGGVTSGGPAAGGGA
jgi:hypothetical protein